MNEGKTVHDFWLTGSIFHSRKFTNSAVQVRHGLITEFRARPPRGARVVSYDDCTICPGLLEMHIHGACGYDFSDGSAEGNEAIATYLASQGVTGFMAAIVSSPREQTLRAVQALVESPPRTIPLVGILFEGPFISPRKRGAHRHDALRRPDIALADELCRQIPPSIRSSFLIAPELPGARELIAHLQSNGTIVALGHSEATVEQTQTALRAGATYGVHLWNAMAPMQHREPAIAGALLADDRACVELIPDGIHVHPAMLKIAIAAAGPHRVACVTDTTGPAGLPPGNHEWNERQVRVSADSLRLADGTLAGANLSNKRLFDVLRSLGVSLSDCIRMRASTPAKIMRVNNRRGSLALGRSATMTVLDHQHETVATIVDGKTVYQR